MKTYFVDTETCGLHGVPVLIQYAIDDGPVNVVHVFSTTLGELMALIKDMVANRVVAHNLRFDWFHLSKLYNMIVWLADEGVGDLNVLKMELGWWHVDILADAEWQSQFGPCLKPHAAVDTLLLASKSEDQSFLMDSKAVYVRRVPVGVAQIVANELNSLTNLPWILFAKKTHREQRWHVADHKNRDTGDIDPEWKDIKITFAPSKSLKDLSAYLCDHWPNAVFDDIMPEERPAEEGYAPFAKLLSSDERGWLYNDKPTWPALINKHAQHWRTNKAAMAYAVDDITMLRKLYNHFGSPLEDRDSIVACQVASSRLRGFAVDIDGVYEQLHVSNQIVAQAQLNVNSPKQVQAYVAAALDPMEQLMFQGKGGCDQKVMDELKKEFTLDEPEECDCENGRIRVAGEQSTSVCCRCGGRGQVGTTVCCEVCHGGRIDSESGEDCKACDGSGLGDDRKMPVVRRVEHIETIRKHTKRIELYHKLLLAKRAYPDFNVIGTKSGRMSGASGLNFQGIDHSHVVRSLFTLADAGLVLSAGDYSSQELAIAATTMNDEDLMKDMASGKSLHGIFGAEAYETSYEDIVKNKDDGRYGKSKGGVFAILYGGTFQTVARNMSIDEKVAESAYNRMIAKYPQMGLTRKKVGDRFSSMKQNADGKIEYYDPPEKFIESVFGFRRYFNTEYQIQRMILDLINHPRTHLKEAGAVNSYIPAARHPVDGTMCPGYNITSYTKVQRSKDKLQTLWGACSSALYGAGFSIQNKIIRASNNHVIQSAGRELTVGMQAHIWDLQPAGIHQFRLTLMSIHDELAVVSKAEEVAAITDTITAKVTEQCETVPLTSIKWFTGNKSWAEKGDGEDGVIIGWNPNEVAV